MFLKTLVAFRLSLYASSLVKRVIVLILFHTSYCLIFFANELALLFFIKRRHLKREARQHRGPSSKMVGKEPDFNMYFNSGHVKVAVVIFRPLGLRRQFVHVAGR
jgi:hypothetical protein